MTTLLEHIIEAHGGLARWNAFTTMSAHLSQGGVLWHLKGKPGLLDEVGVRLELHRPWTSHSPFGSPDRRSAVTPERAAIETTQGKLLDELRAPRASFAGHALDTPWSDTQLAYFVGYAIWNYLTMPFTLAGPDLEISELAPHEEDGRSLRRLQVRFPERLATHSPVQTFYFSEDGLLRRHDYEVDISGGAPAVHYVSDHVTVQGITLPTTHMIYVRNPDGSHHPEPLVVSIKLSAIAFA